jgi:N-methylhydantoinase B
MALDPVLFQVLHYAVTCIADEMSEVLKRSAYSPIVREMFDYSCAIFDAKGQLLAQGPNIPAHLGAMEFMLQGILSAYAPGEVQDGDVFACNHPYRGGMHTPDIGTFAPVFYEDKLIGYVGTLAHHVDVGGKNPGTEGADNVEIFQEGLLLPPVRLLHRGSRNEDVWQIIGANVREPHTTLGDLRAQLAACATGAARLRKLVDKYSLEVVLRAFEELQNYAERLVRACLRELPDAVGRAEGYLDDDGVQTGNPVRVAVTVSKKGDSIVFDFTETSGQVCGALNHPFASTMAVVAYVVRCFTDPAIPQNAGTLRPVSVVVPKGSLLNPDFPRAVSVRHLTSQRLADTLFKALSGMWPDRGVAGSFVGFFSIMAEGLSPKTGRTCVMQDILGGGMGATPWHDGLSAVDVHMSNCGLLPAEICEVEYPWRVECTELVTDSGGAGKFRGGLGIRRSYRALGEEEQNVVLYIEQTNPVFAPAGVAGGQPGTPAQIWVQKGRRPERLKPAKTSLRVRPGWVITVVTSGGGGYGDPRARARDDVLSDVIDGYISRSAAAHEYGLKPSRTVTRRRRG